MIEYLLPVQVACVAVRGDDPSGWLFPQEAAQVAGTADGKLREFTTARCCARQALRKLGLPASAILRGPNGEPLWPPGVVGSITHCQAYRAAAVATQLDVLTLGIDAEIHDELPAGVFDQVVIHQEQAWLKQAPDGVHWDRLLFSAKESVYKAWFPLTGEWLGFKDVVVTFDPAERTFYARLLVASPKLAGADLTGFTGRFLVRDGLALTAVALLKRENLLDEQAIFRLLPRSDCGLKATASR
jgi:4'-phosphopantetheinyl transferase EntD